MKPDFDNKKLSLLLRSFYNLTKVRIAVFDSFYHEIMVYPLDHCKLCKGIHQNEKGDRMCNLSNLEAFKKCSKSKQVYIYHCHAGLVEAMIPLTFDDEILGYIMFGQISDIKDPDSRYSILKDNIDNDIVDPRTLKDKIKAIMYLDEEQLQSASLILEALAKYAISEKMISWEKEKFVHDVLDLIEANFANSGWGTNDIIRRMNMSRTSFYVKMDQYFGMGFASLLKKKRIEKAKELLTYTSLSLAEISEKSGFNDYNYFCRIFKENVGMSAKTYRNNVRTNLK